MPLKPLPSKSKLSLAVAASLEEIQKAGNRASSESRTEGRGELPYQDKVPSSVYKLVFSLLSLRELKVVRQVCKKWHLESFPLLESKTCFHFRGSDNPSDLSRGRSLSLFLKVVPRDSFQWKMLRALYSRPEDALPTPHLVQWSQLRVESANFLELKQWVFRSHLPNVTFLEMRNVRIGWSQYLIILRELENLTTIHDQSTQVCSRIWEEFEKGCGYSEKLPLGIAKGQDQGHLTGPELTFHSIRIKEIKIHRSRVEELVLFLKLFIAMELSRLEILHLIAEDLHASAKLKRKNFLLQGPKGVLFSLLGVLLQNNAETLEELQLSFQSSQVPERFDQFSKERYEDKDSLQYKPDLRDLILVMKHQRWAETVRVRKLKSLKLLLENRKIPTVEEVEYLSTFVLSLPVLKELTISDFLITSYNSLSLPLLLSRLEDPVKKNGMEVAFGVCLRRDTEWMVASDQLPSNLLLFYRNVRTLVVHCDAKEMNVREALFPWEEGHVSRPRPDALTLKRRLSGSIQNLVNFGVSASALPVDDCEVNGKKAASKVQDFWVIDDRPCPDKGEGLKPLFFPSDVVNGYPNLVTLIIRDAGSSLKCNSKDLRRWGILDDFGLQLVLGGLKKLRHFEIKGNLFFLTDCGLTGLSAENCQEIEKRGECDAISVSNSEKNTAGPDCNGNLKSKSESNGHSFSDLSDLEFCRLQFLGPKVTSISLKYAFNNIKSLKHLHLSGLLQVDAEAVRELKKKLSAGKCRVEVVSSIE